VYLKIFFYNLLLSPFKAVKLEEKKKVDDEVRREETREYVTIFMHFHLFLCSLVAGQDCVTLPTSKK